MDQRKIALKRNKTIACGLMAGAAVLFVIARTQNGSGWEWVSAFAEAAMVGALADWFAVVALFKHPLGIPIPHTAIVPNKKETISENLGKFIQEKFLATDVMVSKLRDLDPAGYLSRYLSSRDNAGRLAQGLTRVMTDSIDFLDDPRVQKALRAAMSGQLEKADLSSSAGLLLDTMRKESHHQGVLDEILKRIGAWISTPESQERLAVSIDNWCDTEFPLLARFIPNRPQFARGAGEKIVKRVNGFLQTVNDDPSHELRQEFDRAVTDLIARLKQDTEMRAKIEGIKLEALNNLPLAQYADSVLGDLKSWLTRDLNSPDSIVQKKIADLALALGQALSQNSDLGQSINDHLEKAVRNHADNVRAGVSRHISGTMKEWKSEEFVNEIELSIGSDLQFIRMNGTLVGGLIGLLLHAVSLLIK
jgi:uncharacterized membrane-anchored protein YjiN (DUF445 family)